MKFLLSILATFTLASAGWVWATDLVGGEAPKLLPPEEAIKYFTLHIKNPF